MKPKPTTSEEIFTGTITFRAGSLSPVIRMLKGGEYVLVSIMVECYDMARDKEGQEVQFTIEKNPYPFLVSDHGFAKIL